MGYVEEFLPGNEKIICKGVQKTDQSIYIFFIMAGASFLLFLFSGIASAKEEGTEIFIGALLLTLLISLPFLLFGFARLRKQQTTEIVLTDKRIIYKYGSSNIRLTEIDLNQIEGITLREREGRLLIRGTGTGVMKIPLLENPSKFRKNILETQSLK